MHISFDCDCPGHHIHMTVGGVTVELSADQLDEMLMAGQQALEYATAQQRAFHATVETR